MANPNYIIPFILKWEGNLSADTKDSASKFPVPDGTGNHTNKGITWGVWQSVFGSGPESINKFYKMAAADWQRIFKPLYWDKMGGDKIKSQRIADVLVNWAWAAGTTTPSKAIQKIVGTTPDGIIGPKTIAAINSGNEVDIFTRLKAANITFFNELSALPQYENFKRGWANRLTDLFTNYVTKLKTNSILTFVFVGAISYLLIKNK